MMFLRILNAKLSIKTILVLRNHNQTSEWLTHVSSRMPNHKIKDITCKGKVLIQKRSQMLLFEQIRLQALSLVLATQITKSQTTNNGMKQLA
jgi:hypothetical protein